MGENDGVSLPPGFHFHPTDEELILHFLYPRSFLSPPHHQIIPDLNYLSHPPWELHAGKALASGKEWYFFSSPVRGNMETGNGFWKNSESEEPIFTSAGIQVGIRALHVFCIGRAPTGVETNWVMHEYHLCNRDGLSSGNSDGASHSRRRRRSQNTERNRWVLCRVYEDDNRNCRRGSRHDCGGENNDGCSVELSCLDEIFLSLDDDFDEVCLPNQ